MSGKGLTVGQNCPRIEPVKGSEFLRKLKKAAKDRGVEYRLETHHGKGSHATVYFGDRCATIKDARKRSALACTQRCSSS
jgi:hypothetical protein